MVVCTAETCNHNVEPINKITQTYLYCKTSSRSIPVIPASALPGAIYIGL
jgi:hypothetical protein